MTTEEYDKKKAEIEYKANIEKGKLAEQYLKDVLLHCKPKKITIKVEAEIEE